MTTQSITGTLNITQAITGTMPANSIAALFEGAGDRVSIERENITDHYLLHQHMGGGRYFSLRLEQKTAPDGSTLRSMTQLQSRRLIQMINDTDGGITYSGAGWTTGISVPNLAWGDTYARTTATGDYVEWTTAATATRIGFCGYVTTKAGLVLAAIDGDTTAATSMETAQAIVDRGRYPNTILVANGGTLNPTDRVVDLNEAGDRAFIDLVDGLSAAARTVRITNTGYTTQSEARLYITATYIDAPAGEVLGDTGIISIQDQSILAVDSVNEYAIGYLSGAATDDSFNGNGHGYDNEVGFAFVVDGAATTLGLWESASGASSIVVTRTSEMTHPDLGATKTADVVLTYTMHPTDGLTIAYTITWSVSGTSINYYPSMFAVGALLDKGAALGSGADVTLTDDDSSQKAAGDYAQYMLWDADGNYGAYVRVLDAAGSLNNWTEMGAQAYIQDRSGGDINKVYFARHFGAAVSFSAANTYTGSANYRLAYFDDADGTLAGLG